MPVVGLGHSVEEVFEGVVVGQGHLVETRHFDTAVQLRYVTG
ncbi:hypothetical protein ACFYUD_00150 [Nocardia tengchongensis]